MYIVYCIHWTLVRIASLLWEDFGSDEPATRSTIMYAYHMYAYIYHTIYISISAFHEGIPTHLRFESSLTTFRYM